MMQPFHNSTIPYEIALDECGRGPLFGRVYAAAVVLPKTGFDYSLMRDSKKIKSKKKMAELSKYIQEHAVAYSIHYIEADVIDQINILQADMRAMHNCVRDVVLEIMNREPSTNFSNFEILVDGNYFKPFTHFDEKTESVITIPETTIEKGDNTYHSIAAASILAKHARDSYIDELCKQYPILVDRYGLNTNMGYGTKKHMEGIREHGITQWHRKSFSPCSHAFQTFV
jgi:ribonuclease HII